ncbi:MAG: hypothetical protein ACT4P8_07995, partial [Betaproteobacteria bacterium]
LRTISTLLNIAAVLILLVCVIAGLVLWGFVKGGVGFVAGALVAVWGVVFWLFLKAAAEALVVLVDIERNTRVAALELKERVQE